MLYRFWLLTSIIWAGVCLVGGFSGLSNMSRQPEAVELLTVICYASAYPSAALLSYKAVRWMIEGH